MRARLGADRASPAAKFPMAKATFGILEPTDNEAGEKGARRDKCVQQMRSQGRCSSSKRWFRGAMIVIENQLDGLAPIVIANRP